MRSNLKNSAAVSAFALYSAPKEGAESDESSFDAKAIKAAYLESTGKKLDIKNTILVQLLEQHPEFVEMDDEAQLKFLGNLAEMAKGVAITDPVIGELVAKIDDATSKEIVAEVEKVIEAGTTSMKMLGFLRKIYTRDELLSMATPGLEKSKMVKGDNRKPDIVITTAKNGDEIKTVWTDEFCSDFGPVKVWETDMEELKKEKSSSGSVPKYKHLSKRELSNLLKLATKRRNTLRSMFKRALLTEHQLAAIEGMPKVEIVFSEVNSKDTISKFVPIAKVYGKGNKIDGKDVMKVTQSNSPFWMWPKGAPQDAKEYSMGQICNMDVLEAISNGGEMSDLTATLEKGPDDETDLSGDGSQADIVEAYDFTVKTANWFGQRGNIALIRKVLSNPKNDGYADWLQLIGDIAVAVSPTYRRNKEAYEALGNQDATSQDDADQKKTGTED